MTARRCVAQHGCGSWCRSQIPHVACETRVTLALRGILIASFAAGACVAPGTRAAPPRANAPKPAAGAPAHAPNVDGDGDALRVTARRSGKLIGAAVNAWQLPGNVAYREVLAREFDYVTPENCMKWGELEKRRGVLQFDKGDELVAFAEQHGMKVKGHALLWHQMLPAWVGKLSADELRAAVSEHIRAVVGHWKGRIAAWDVVNEAFEDNGSYRQSPLFAKLGEGYIADAFRAAHEADPQALLFYNDYNAEGLGAKADAVFALVRKMKADGVPVSGVGLQMHLDARTGVQPKYVAQNMARLAALGLLVNISEMDVRIRGLRGSDEQRLNRQREIYRDMVAVCVAEPACHGVTLWGFTDAHSWVDGFFGPDDPLPFDEAYRRKPAFYGIRDAFAGERR